MITGLTIKEIESEIWEKYPDNVDVEVKLKNGRIFSFFKDSFGRAILHHRGYPMHFSEVYNIKLIIVGGVKYKPLDSFWGEVPEDEFEIVAHDPNPHRCGTYEAKIKQGELVEENNIECFFKEALSDMSWNEMSQYDTIDYIYIDRDGTEYEGTVHII